MTDLDLGERIRSHREQQGLSQQGLAARCGCSQPYIAAIERGRQTPSLALLERIARAVQTTTATILAKSHNPQL